MNCTYCYHEDFNEVPPIDDIDAACGCECHFDFDVDESYEDAEN